LHYSRKRVFFSTLFLTFYPNCIYIDDFRTYGDRLEVMTMKKTLSLIMIALMIASTMLYIVPEELNADLATSDAGRAAGDEVRLHDVTSPRESYTDAFSGEVRNQIDAGTPVPFVVVVKNDGTNDLNNLNVEVTVTANADSDNPSTVFSADDQVICYSPDPTNPLCPYDTLTAGSWLANGAYTVKNTAGSDALWTPSTAGTYQVQVSLTGFGDQDTDLTNNELSYTVTVVDWNDIDVDICWLDGNPNDASTTCYTDEEAASRQAVEDGSSTPFRISMTPGGSMDEWDARSVNVTVSFGGNYDGGMSTIDDGTGAQITIASLVGASQNYILGTPTDVEVWHNTSDSSQTSDNGAYPNPCSAQNNPCVQSRNIAENGTTYSLDGWMTPDTATTSGFSAFSVDVQFNNHVIYTGESIDDTGDQGNQQGGGGTLTEVNFEDVIETDARAGNNYDTITGTFGVFHNIKMEDLTIGEDGFSGGLINVGPQWVRGVVIHDGSSPTNLYEWNMTFEVTNGDGTVDLFYANSCTEMPGDMTYPHRYLGTSDSDPEAANFDGVACVQVMFNPGTISIRATANFLGGSDGTALEELTVSDNFKATQIEGINDVPNVDIRIGDLANDPPVVGDDLFLEARASDSETVEAGDLNYTWSLAGGDREGLDVDTCQSGVGMMMCQLDETGAEWVGTTIITVTVCDIYNACATDQKSIVIWNHMTVSGQGTSPDWAVDYSLTYNNGFNDHNLSFVTADAITGASLEGLTSSYDSVVAFEIGNGLSWVDENSTVTAPYYSMGPNLVASETLSVTFTGDVTDDFTLWRAVATGSGWGEMTTTKTAAENGQVTLSWSQTGDQPNLPQTQFAIFQASAATSLPPATGVQCDGVTLGASGEMVIKWKYEDETLLNEQEDRPKIYVDDVYSKTMPSVSDKQTIITGTHAQSYKVEVKLENGNGANSVSCTHNSIIADGKVDPSSVVSGMTATVTASDISLNWEATNTTDVDHWMVCWSLADFSANDFGSLACQEMTDATTELTLSKATVCASATCAGTYYFAVAGVDANGNKESSDAQASVDLSETVVDPGVIPGEGTEEVDAGIPQGALMAIVAVVVVAVIAGAVILTRGGGSEGDDEFDY
jgi:hypothetical protein